MQTQTVEYKLDDLVMEGFLAIGETTADKQPLVLVVHDWSGHNEFAQEKAKYFAKQGYIGFAVDLYGKGKRGSQDDKSRNRELMNELMRDRAQVVTRLQAALDYALGISNVDSERVMAIGFCMGGLCVLDFARSGADLKGVVSVHGLLNAPEQTSAAVIQAKVLALHGHDDPSVDPQQVLAFETEMTKRNVDWQVHVFGNTQHAFTNPQANDKSAGLMFNALSNARTWELVRSFAAEVLA